MKRQKFFTNDSEVLAQLERIKSAPTKRLNKLGEWLLTPEGQRGVLTINDMRAVLR